MRGDWTQSQRQRIDPEQVELLTNTVAKGCNLHELNLLLEIGGRYGLNPFLGQIFAAKFDGEDGGVTIFTGRDGMLQAARNTGKYVRTVSGVVREHDFFEVETALGGDVENVDPAKGVQIDPATRLVHVREGMGSKRGPIIGAYALVYRAGDPFPTYAEASWEDYGATRQEDPDGKPTSWTLNHRDGFPEAMMIKVPQSIGYRMAFGLSGLVSAEELGDRPQRVQNLTSPVVSTSKSKPIVVEYGDDDLGRELFELVKAANELKPGSWKPIKVAVRINGHPSERAKLRDTLRRSLGSMGDRGRSKLEAIPATKVQADPAPEPEAAAVTPEPTDEAQTTLEEQIADAVVVDEPAPEYDRRKHLALARKITKQRAKIVAMDSQPPTLEAEEERERAERLLAAQLVELERFNVAAEAAGKKRKDA